MFGIKRRKFKKERAHEVSWHKQKKRHRLYYRAIYQNPRPILPIYILEILVCIPIELLRRVLKFLKWTAYIGVALSLIVGVFLLFKIYPIYKEYNAFAEEVVTSISRDDFAINESSTVYDSKGNVIAILKEDADLQYLDYDDIPEAAVNAFIAIEDRTYWSNIGIDPKGILRIGIDYIRSRGSSKHGASTITQQLVKNVYLSSEVTLERKAKEILISLALTKQFTKREIMEFYVNNICFANGIYGLSGAAKAYFNKSVDELSLSQIAYLCAIPNSPEYYNPLANPENAIERRDKILQDMCECGYIQEPDMLKAMTEEIQIERPKAVFNNYQTTYAMDCAVRYFMQLDGFEFRYVFENSDDYDTYKTAYNDKYYEMKHKLNTGGYKVYTSLNSKLNKKLQKILDTNLEFDEEVDEETGVYALQGAITCIDNKTGKVTAIIGGRSQKQSTYSFNRAYQSTRQPGSTFKPIAVYTPALESGLGYTDKTVVQNIDVDKAKEPGVNIQALRGTQMSLRSAVEQSKNGVAWQIFDRITPEVGLGYITEMEFSSIPSTDYVGAAALGGLTYGVSTVEMASAYSALANHGVFCSPTCITSILDKDGKELYVEAKKKTVYTAKAADDMVDILKGVLTVGTAKGLSWGSASEVEAFAKTGTTNKCKDGWLCGATPYYSIAVWIGYDIPRELSDLFGATYPGRVWKESMLAALGKKEAKSFERDSDDESYTNAGEDTYYTYLPGRSDTEVLSPGYTVADYRKDRVIGESVKEVIKEIEELDIGVSGASDRLDNLYNKAKSIIGTIYSTNYTNEMNAALQEAYMMKGGLIE